MVPLAPVRRCSALAGPGLIPADVQPTDVQAGPARATDLQAPDLPDLEAASLEDPDLPDLEAASLEDPDLPDLEAASLEDPDLPDLEAASLEDPDLDDLEGSDLDDLRAPTCPISTKTTTIQSPPTPSPSTSHPRLATFDWPGTRTCRTGRPVPRRPCILRGRAGFQPPGRPPRNRARRLRNWLAPADPSRSAPARPRPVPVGAVPSRLR